MKESTFQSEISRSVKLLYPYAEYNKIPDPSQYVATKTIRRPYDCFGLKKELFFAFELKQRKKIERLPFDILEPHQRYHLNKVKANGGVSGIIVNFRIDFILPVHKKKYGFSSRINKSYFFDIVDWDTIRQQFGKSVSVDMVAALLSGFMEQWMFSIIEIQWISKQKIWDIRSVLEKEKNS